MTRALNRFPECAARGAHAPWIFWTETCHHA